MVFSGPSALDKEGMKTFLRTATGRNERPCRTWLQHYVCQPGSLKFRSAEHAHICWNAELGNRGFLGGDWVDSWGSKKPHWPSFTRMLLQANVCFYFPVRGHSQVVDFWLCNGIELRPFFYSTFLLHLFWCSCFIFYHSSLGILKLQCKTFKAIYWQKCNIFIYLFLLV